MEKMDDSRSPVNKMVEMEKKGKKPKKDKSHKWYCRWCQKGQGWDHIRQDRGGLDPKKVVEKETKAAGSQRKPREEEPTPASRARWAKEGPKRRETMAGDILGALQQKS